jgi:hypothetical protein
MSHLKFRFAASEVLLISALKSKLFSREIVSRKTWFSADVQISMRKSVKSQGKNVVSALRRRPAAGRLSFSRTFFS